MLKLFLILTFIRPFLSSLAFIYANAVYSQALLILLAVWILRKGLPYKEIRSIRYPLTAFSLALVVSVLFSLRPINSLRESYKYLSGLLIFIIASSFGYEKKEKVIKTLILSGVIISLIAIYQYLFGFSHLAKQLLKDNLQKPFALDWIARRRVYLPFVTPNILAGYLGMIILLAAGQCPTKRIYLLGLLPLFTAFLLTKSLGAFLSLFLSVFIYFCCSAKFKKRHLIILLFLFFIALLDGFLRSQQLGEHTRPWFSLTMRLDYWKDTFKIILAHPFKGIGLGNFNLPHSRFSHNSYLQLWAEMGILGLSSFLWLVGAVLIKSLRKDKNPGLAAILSANLVFLIHNLVDFSFFLPEVSLLWWVCLGLLRSFYSSK